MRTAVERQSEEAEKVVGDIRRATRRQYSAEEKVRLVIAGLRGEESIAELCRKEGTTRICIIGGPRSFWRRARNDWRVTRRAKRPATKSKGLRSEAQQLKESLAEVLLENRLLKKV